MLPTRYEPGDVVVDRFEIVRPLSAGGMGMVFEVTQRGLGVRRALKVLRPELAALPNFRARFEHEAWLGTQVQSPHVLEVLDAGFDGNRHTPWILTELLTGQDLQRALDATPLLGDARIDAVLHALHDAVGAAHDIGLLHLDLKPANLFLSQTPRGETVKVLDFGISRLLADGNSSITVRGAEGSPQWMAPEQAETGERLRPSADVWAIGLLAFQLLTGVSYWHTARLKGARLREIIGEVLFGVLESAGARARAFGAPGTLPEGFDEWFARCVVRTPKARFPHAREALDALRAIRRRALEQSSRATEVDPASRFREAAAYTREARYELALAAVDDALLLAPKVPEYRVLRARCLLALGQRERARNEVAGVLLRHPDHVAALFVHGDASLAAGAISQAALDYTAVLMRDPRRVEALTARAKAFLAMGRFHDALCDLECAHTTAPDDEVVSMLRSDVRRQLTDPDTHAIDRTMLVDHR
jgi:serine/threonine protein kinase